MYTLITLLPYLLVAVAGYPGSDNEVEDKFPTNLRSTTLPNVKPETFNFDYSKLSPQSTAQSIREYIAAQLSPPPPKEIPKQTPPQLKLQEDIMPQGDVAPKELQPAGIEPKISPTMHHLQPLQHQHQVPQNMIVQEAPKTAHFIQQQGNFQEPQMLHQHQHHQAQQVRIPLNNPIAQENPLPPQQSSNTVPQNQMPLPNLEPKHHIDHRNLQQTAAPQSASVIYQQQLPTSQNPIAAQNPQSAVVPQQPRTEAAMSQITPSQNHHHHHHRLQQQLQVMQNPMESKSLPVQILQQHQVPNQQNTVSTTTTLPPYHHHHAPIATMQPVIPQPASAINYLQMKQLQELAALNQLHAIRHQNAMTTSQVDLLLKLLSLTGAKSNLANVHSTVNNQQIPSSPVNEKKVVPSPTKEEMPAPPTSTLQERKEALVRSMTEKNTAQPIKPIQQKKKLVPPKPAQKEVEKEQEEREEQETKEAPTPTVVEKNKEVASSIRKIVPSAAPQQIFIQFFDLSPEVYKHLIASPVSSENQPSFSQSKSAISQPQMPNFSKLALIANAVKTFQASSSPSPKLNKQSEVKNDEEPEKVNQTPTDENFEVESD